MACARTSAAKSSSATTAHTALKWVFLLENVKNDEFFQVFDYEGHYLRQIGGEGVTNYPIGVGINSSGEVVVADNHNNFNLTIFNQVRDFLIQKGFERFFEERFPEGSYLLEMDLCVVFWVLKSYAKSFRAQSCISRMESCWTHWKARWSTRNALTWHWWMTALWCWLAKTIASTCIAIRRPSTRRCQPPPASNIGWKRSVRSVRHIDNI